MAPTKKHAGDKVFEFESTLAKLNALVEIMENDSTTLNQSLTAYEDGLVLTKEMQQFLSEADQKVHLLRGSNSNARPEEVHDEDGE